MKKKFLSMLLIGILAISLTGCGKEVREDTSKDETKVEEKSKNKILSCSQTYGDVSSVITFLYDLDGKNFSKFTREYTLKIEYEEIEEAAEFCKHYDTLKTIKNCDAKLNGNKLLGTLDYDIDKLDKAENGFTKNTPIDELKELMESDSNVTCEIEEN